MCKSILIVEDDEVNIYFLRKFIQKYFNVDIDSVEKVEKALKKISMFEYSLVITDISFPGKSGHEVVRKCLDSNIPIMVITGYSPNMIFVDKRVKACLQKPIIADQFIESVRGILKVHDLKEIEYA